VQQVDCSQLKKLCLEQEIVGYPTIRAFHNGAQASDSVSYTHTHLFDGPLSGTIQVSQYQKGKTNLGFTDARDSEWQWHQLGHMQVCTWLQTDNHAGTPPLSFFNRPDAFPVAQPTASKH